jgi:hypothetical protein
VTHYIGTQLRSGLAPYFVPGTYRARWRASGGRIVRRATDAEVTAAVAFGEQALRCPLPLRSLSTPAPAAEAPPTPEQEPELEETRRDADLKRELLREYGGKKARAKK